MKKKLISEIVDENYVFGEVLHYLGIKFYDYSEKTLEEVCQQSGLDLERVVYLLEAEERVEATQDEVAGYPIELILEYLRHKHHTFVKYRLPYLASLICNIHSSGDYKQLIDDLKFIFPDFVIEFIVHLHEEEDNLFAYIINLSKYLKSFEGGFDLYSKLENSLIAKYSLEHEIHTGEMDGIKDLTNNYAYNPKMGLHLKVILNELESFDKELQKHANIEDGILFPMALHLESKVLKIYKQTVISN